MAASPEEEKETKTEPNIYAEAIALAPRGDTVDKYTTADGKTIEVADPYRFLEDPDSEATKKWIEAENKIKNDFFDKLDLREKTKEKLTEYWDYTKVGVPEKHGDHYYFYYNFGKFEQSILLEIKEKNSYKINKDDPMDGTNVFLDPNYLSVDGTASLYDTAFSHDGKYMAYLV